MRCTRLRTEVDAKNGKGREDKAVWTPAAPNSPCCKEDKPCETEHIVHEDSMRHGKTVTGPKTGLSIGEARWRFLGSPWVDDE
jgi:hypothetical protein